MAARLTDSKKKKIIADYVTLRNYAEVARINNVSDNTVRNIIKGNPEISVKFEEKKEENTQDILAYMESQREVVCSIIGKGLKILNDEEKLSAATPSQITTALGTLIDKWTAAGINSNDTTEEDALSKSLKELAGEMKNEYE